MGGVVDDSLDILKGASDVWFTEGTLHGVWSVRKFYIRLDESLVLAVWSIRQVDWSIEPFQTSYHVCLWTRKSMMVI